MATTTMPKFRLCWLPVEEKEDMCKTEIQKVTSLESREPPAAAMNTISETDGSDDDFLCLGRQTGLTEAQLRKRFGSSSVIL